jgi:hypothetical protein
MNKTEQPRKYFDLHLSGLGYLSRVREVNPAGHGRAKARPFLACSIAAFHGDPAVQNGIVYLNLDLIVSGEKAKDAVLSVMNDANDREVKVLVPDTTPAIATWRRFNDRNTSRIAGTPNVPREA